jgi:hypothetical protein
MAVLLSPVYFSPDNPLWLSKNISSLILRDLDVSTLSVSSLTGNTISVSSLTGNTISVSSLMAISNMSQSTFTNSLSSLYSETKEQYVDDKLTLDTQVLTANSTQLLLNGIPLATISNLSSLSQWSLDPAISDVLMSGFSIYNISNTQTKNLAVSTITGSNASFINLFTQNLMAFNVVTFTSTFIDTYESTIQSDIKLANISTANICNLTVTSNATISNANISGAVFTDAPTFNNGATFNGTRPNFNTGINTTGPNNFNNCNIDNASNITGAIINVTVGGQTNITADAGANILGNPAINLATQGGGTSAIRIYANQCSAFAFPIPNSSVDILAEGNVSYIPIAPVPYGGTITMRAKAGGANPLTNPLSVLAGNGAIRLQADSYFSFGNLVPPIPGVIGLAGGAVLAYSGLTTPVTGPYGCSFYSALTCLSLTCGLSPALTSYPGTVYLRGDNGTKVLNGLYVDTLYNSIGVDLNITSQSGNWVNIDKVQSIRMSNSGLLDGGGAGSRICNVETITASNINVSNISTNAITLPQLYTSFINIAPSNTVYISAPDLTINANVVTDEGEDPLPNNLNLLASANINIIIPNNNAYSINMSGNVYASKNLYVTCNVDTNRAVIGAGGINMCNNSITNVNTISALSTQQLTITQIAGSDFVLFNNGDTRMNAKRNASVSADGSIDIVSPSTNQITINQTAGSDFVLFNNGDTRMNAIRDAYVVGNRDTYLLAQQNMNVRAPYTQYVTIQQTGAPTGDSFIQFTPNGTIDQFSRENMTIRTFSTNNITLLHNGAGNQSYFQLSPAGHTVLNARTYFETIASSGIYLTSPFTELRGYLTFNTSNNYINNLRHIYGDTGWAGGGLAIDYMYGMFFNGAGKNAGLFADAGNLTMINYNSGINIANYNSNGTGNISIYSASNEVLLATGNGRNIALNSGSNIYLNAIGSDGLVAVYASTMNTYTLQDTNITALRNMTLNSSSNTSINSVIDTNITAQKNMTLSASNSGNYITLNSGQVNRTLSGVSIAQPVIQYNTEVVSGSSGSVAVTLPTAYTTVGSYVAFISMEDTTPAEVSVSRDTDSQITLYWNSGGSGSHTLAWMTTGT